MHLALDTLKQLEILQMMTSAHSWQMVERGAARTSSIQLVCVSHLPVSAGPGPAADGLVAACWISHAAVMKVHFRLAATASAHVSVRWHQDKRPL